MHALEGAHALAATLRAMRPESSRSVTVHPLTPDGRSWLIHADRWWPLDDAAIQTLWKARPVEPTRGVIMGRSVDFPRRTAAFGVDYKYTGQVQHSTPFSEAPTPLREVVSALCDAGEAPPFRIHNAALVNWYEASTGEYMGAHSDDEKELVRRAPVVSLSWTTRGHYRRFRFTAKKHAPDAMLPDAWGFGPGCMPLRNGCLVVMGGQCQSTHKHELMKSTKQLGECEGRRINLTLRAFEAGPAAASRKRQRDNIANGESAGPAPQAPQAPRTALAAPIAVTPIVAPPANARPSQCVTAMVPASGGGVSSSAIAKSLAAALPPAAAKAAAAAVAVKATTAPTNASIGHASGDGSHSSTDASSSDSRTQKTWSCGVCTYIHEESETDFLCCKVCQAEKGV